MVDGARPRFLCSEIRAFHGSSSQRGWWAEEEVLLSTVEEKKQKKRALLPVFFLTLNTSSSQRPWWRFKKAKNGKMMVLLTSSRWKQLATSTAAALLDGAKPHYCLPAAAAWYQRDLSNGIRFSVIPSSLSNFLTPISQLSLSGLKFICLEEDFQIIFMPDSWLL